MGDLLGLEPEGEISPKRGCRKQEAFFLNHIYLFYLNKYCKNYETDFIFPT